MKNLGARSSIIVGLGAAALMLTSIACGSSSATTGTGGSGGESATGGTAGGGAKGGAGGAAKPIVVQYTFDTSGSKQGFTIQNYIDTSQYKNLGALAADAGVPDGGTYPAAVQMDGVGQGTPATGALKVTADFTDFQQYVEVKVALSPPKDLSGTKLHASIQVTSSFYGGAFIYAKSGSTYVSSNANGTGLTSVGTYTPLVLDLNTATSSGTTPFDPTTIEEIDIHIYSNGATDGGTFPMPGEYTFYIDNVYAQ